VRFFVRRFQPRDLATAFRQAAHDGDIVNIDVVVIMIGWFGDTQPHVGSAQRWRNCWCAHDP
jgi:hypothetical protein